MADRASPWIPDWSVRPGEILSETLRERSMSQAELARRLGRPEKTISEIVTGKTALTPETAIQLERVLGISPSFWNAAESKYREGIARHAAANALEQHAEWADAFPIRDLVRYKQIDPPTDKNELVASLLAYFQVSSPEGWQSHWGRIAAGLRSSRAIRPMPASLSAWIRWGEREVERLQLAEYQPEAFRGVIRKARGYTKAAVPGLAVESLRGDLERIGVALVVLPELSGTRVSGAAYWFRLTPVIQLSLRYRWNDQFWYSLFHEAGHVVQGARQPIVEDALAGRGLDDAADQFARDLLIPPRDYANFVSSADFSADAVKSFAGQEGIGEAIVVGRLQHDKHLRSSQLNFLKVRYSFE